MPGPGAAVAADQLPPSASAIYKQWWSTVTHWAAQADQFASRFDLFATAQAAAAAAAREDPASYGTYNPPGLSALLSRALAQVDAQAAIAAAGPGDAITPDMIATSLYHRTDAEMAALPEWQARVAITYTDPNGDLLTGFSTVTIPQVLPSSVGSLQAQMELRVTDQLSSPPGTGTPRSGSLVSVDSITLLAV